MEVSFDVSFRSLLICYFLLLSLFDISIGIRIHKYSIFKMHANMLPSYN